MRLNKKQARILVRYLYDHETDIIMGENDFGKLMPLLKTKKYRKDAIYIAKRHSGDGDDD